MSVQMYVCVFMLGVYECWYMCVCLFVLVLLCVCICVCFCMCVCAFVNHYMCVCMFACTCICMLVCVRGCVYVFVCICVRVCVYVCLCMYISKCMTAFSMCKYIFCLKRGCKMMSGIWTQQVQCMRARRRHMKITYASNAKPVTLNNFLFRKGKRRSQDFQALLLWGACTCKMKCLLIS